jgi:hypothetical protein
MDNALIDDRRIHVDFSQSVSKLWSQYMRKDNKGNNITISNCFIVLFYSIVQNANQYLFVNDRNLKPTLHVNKINNL